MPGVVRVGERTTATGLRAFVDIEEYGPSSTWVLVGEGLAVQFQYHDLSQVVRKDSALLEGPLTQDGKLPTDLGYHSATPIWGYEAEYDPCHVLGIACYYDGSSLNAATGLSILTEVGPEATWLWLEGYFRDMLIEQQSALKGSRP